MEIANAEADSRRTDRVTLDPAAWIRWRERVAMELEAAGAQIEDVPLSALKGWFERHIGAADAARRALNHE